MGNFCSKSTQSGPGKKYGPSQTKISTFIPGSWIKITNPIINVGLGWDFYGNDVFDLDASVTGFDECTQVVEAIYFGHKDGLNQSVHHHGDNLTGEGDGDDEVITINLEKVPSNVMSLAVTVNSYKSNSIIKAKSAFIRLYDSSTKQEIGIFILNKTKDCIGMLLGLFERNRNEGGWYFRVMVDPIEGNVVTNSFESLKVLIQGYSPTLTSSPSAVARHPFPQEATFLPGNWIDIQCALTYVGLGWDIAPGQIYDLDASIITFNNENNVVDIVYHKNMKSQDGSIVHNGDNKTGIGEGDDEVITVNFPMISQNINTLAVVVNSFKGINMSGVNSGFIRIFSPDFPIGCHLIGKGKEDVGLLLGLFRRGQNNLGWYFQVMIEPVPGTEATQSVEQVKALVEKYGFPS